MLKGMGDESHSLINIFDFYCGRKSHLSQSLTESDHGLELPGGSGDGLGIVAHRSQLEVLLNKFLRKLRGDLRLAGLPAVTDVLGEEIPSDLVGLDKFLSKIHVLHLGIE